MLFLNSGHAFADVDYSIEVKIEKVDDEYRYGNNGVYYFADTLQEIITELASHEDYVSVYFSNITTDEVLVFANSRFDLNGNLVSTCEDYTQFFITLQSGEIRLKGLTIQSKISAIHILEGANFVSDAASILVRSESAEICCAAICVGGTAKINSIIIDFDGKYCGSAILQNNSNSYLEIGDIGSDYFISLKGNSMGLFQYGKTVINCGVFRATRSTYSIDGDDGNTSSGFALNITAEGQVTVNGGSFYSDRNPETVVGLSGNAYAEFEFLGGDIYGAISVAPQNPIFGGPPCLRLSDRTVVPTQGVGFVLKSNEEKLTPQNIIFSTYEENVGFAFDFWTNGVDDLKQNEVPLEQFLTGNISIVPTNIYQVIIEVDGGEILCKQDFKYGQKVDITEYVTLPSGIVAVWSRDNDVLESTEFVVTGYNHVKATLSLEQPVCELLNDISMPFSGDEILVTPKCSQSSNAELTYIWQTWIDYGEYWSDGCLFQRDNSLVFNGVDGCGLYRCKIIASLSVLGCDLSSEIYSNPISVNIYKGYDKYIPEVEFEDHVYNENLILADFILPQNFAWENVFIHPTVPVKQYKALYCSDPQNFEYSEVMINIDLIKATHQYIYHEQFPNPDCEIDTYNPKNTLASFQLAQYFRWDDPDEVPNCSNKFYKAIYNSDVDNYEDCVVYIKIDLNKAQYSDIDDCSLEIVYKNGFNINAIASKLPFGYILEESDNLDVQFNSVGDYVLNLKYNADPQNYQTLVDVKLSLKILMGEYEDLPEVILSGYYDSSKTLADFVFEQDSGLRWADSTQGVLLGEHKYLAIYDLYPNLFNAKEIYVTLIANEPALEIKHKNVEVVFKEGLQLKDICLDDGFEWLYPEMYVFSGLMQPFDAKFIDVQNNEYFLSVYVSVSKAKVDLSAIKFQDVSITYDGFSHSIFYEGTLPYGFVLLNYFNNEQTDVGEYEVSCLLLQQDTNNYEQVEESQLCKKATLTITKAEAIFTESLVQSVVYDAKSKYVKAGINNQEQTLVSDIENKFSKVGQYTIVFTAKESKNYVEKSFTVQFTINNSSLEASKKGIKVNISNTVVGFGPDMSLYVNISSSNSKLVVINLSSSGGDMPQNTDVSIKMPKDYNLSELVAIKDSTGKSIDFSAKDGVVSLNISELGDLTFDFGYIEPTTIQKETKKYTYALEISLGVIAGLGLVGVVVFLVISKRRKKHENK